MTQFTKSSNGLLLPSGMGQTSVAELDAPPEVIRPNELSIAALQYARKWVPGSYLFKRTDPNPDRNYREINRRLREAREDVFYVECPAAAFKHLARPGEEMKTDVGEVWVHVRDGYAYRRLVMFDFVNMRKVSVDETCRILIKDDKTKIDPRDKMAAFYDKKKKDDAQRKLGIWQAAGRLGEKLRKHDEEMAKGSVSIDMGRNQSTSKDE